jgi:hypothetical protein
MEGDITFLVGTFDRSVHTLATTLSSIEKHITEQRSIQTAQQMALEERRLQVEEEERELGEEEKSFRKEVKAFLSLKGAAANDDEILELNVGGEPFTTTKSTLCSVSGSMLEAMFSGRHTLKQKEGRYFLDRDPVIFR